MIVSSIDIGTNTVLMAVVEVLPDRTCRVLADEHAVARIGKGVDAKGRIDDNALDRLAAILVRYSDISASLGAEKIICFGTSALRDASNRDEFIDRLRDRTGIGVCVLSGKEEASLTFVGALFGLEEIVGPEAVCAVLDIGGGSTELALGTRSGGVTQSISVDIGAVRLRERHLLSTPPTSSELSLARHWSDIMVGSLFDLPSATTLIGVAGTVTTLAALDAGMERFDAEELNGYRLGVRAIADWTTRLSTMAVEDIQRLKGVHPDRADILAGGAIILDAALARLEADAILVSTRGVRYGVALEGLEIG